MKRAAIWTTGLLVTLLVWAGWLAVAYRLLLDAVRPGWAIAHLWLGFVVGVWAYACLDAILSSGEGNYGGSD